MHMGYTNEYYYNCNYYNYLMPLSCLIRPVWCWGDKKDSANTFVLPHIGGEVGEA